MASGETLTLNSVTLDSITPVRRHRRPRQRLLDGDHRQHHRVRHAPGRHAGGSVGQTLTLDDATLDNVILLGGTDDLDGDTSIVNTDSTIEYATLQDGTLAVAVRADADARCVTLDNVTLFGGTDDLDGATSW